MPLPEVHLHYLIRTASGPTARLRRPQAHNSREHAFSLCTAIVTPPTPHNNTTATNPDPSNRSQPGAQSGPVARLICTDGQTLSIIRYQIERAPGLARKVSSLRNLQAAGTVSVQAQASALPVLAPIRTNIQMRPMRLPADYQPPGEAQDGLATAVIHSVSKSPHTGRPVPQPAAPAPAADTPSAAARKPKLSVLVPGGSDPGSGAQGGGGSGVIAAGRGEGGTETHLALASEAVNRALPQLGEGSALVWLREQQLQGRPTSDTKDLAGKHYTARVHPSAHMREYANKLLCNPRCLAVPLLAANEKSAQVPRTRTVMPDDLRCVKPSRVSFVVSHVFDCRCVGP